MSASSGAVRVLIRLAEHRLLTGDGAAWFEWGNRAAAVARRGGRRLSGRGRAAAGMGVHLLYGAALGAAYGAARSRGLSVPAQRVLESLLTYGAYLAERQRPSARGLLRVRARRRRRRGIVPVGTYDIFGQATARAFQALLR
jgi:hypothetical protein